MQQTIKHNGQLVFGKAQTKGYTTEISTSSQYDQTLRKDTHSSPKQLSDKSPTSNDQMFSGRLSDGCSLDNKGERSNLTRYRDRGGDLSLERSLHQDRTLAKIPYKESTRSASSISRGGHFSGISSVETKTWQGIGVLNCNVAEL